MDELVVPNTPRGKPGGKNEELDLGEIVRLFLRHKFLLAFLVITAVITASLEHLSFPSFRVIAMISVANSDNSYTQALTSRLTGAAGGGVLQADSYHEVPEKYFQHLASFDYFLSVAKAVHQSKEFETLNPDLFLRKTLIESLRHRVKKFLFHEDADVNHTFSDDRLASILTGWLTFGKSGTDNIVVTATTSDPALTLFIINIAADSAVKYITEHEVKELNEGGSYLKVQLDEAEREIKNTDALITDFKRSNQLVSMDMAQGDSNTLAVGLRHQLEDVDITIAENNKLLKHLANSQRLQLAEVSKEDQAANTKSKYGIGHKIVDLERENQYLEARRETVKRVLDELMRNQDPHMEQRIFDLRKKVELQYSLYQELKKQTFQVEMERIFVQNRVRFFEKARDFNVVRSLTLNKKILIAVVIAFLIGGFGAYLWELVVPRIKNRYDLDDLNTIYLGGIPDMSRVPSVQRVFVNAVTNKKGQIDRTGAILCRFDIDSPSAMAFKHIRTRILHLSERSGGHDQIISVHSAQVGEGKTFISANLASCIAHLKRKVLLVDCDLRRGTTSEIFRTKSLVGLSEVLSAEEKFGAVVKRNVLPLLDLLPSGRNNQDATEMIASGRFAELLEDLRSIYDYIILDTPPVIVVPDSGLIAQHADMVLMLADCNSSIKENLSTAIETILNLKQKRIYSILNRLEGSRQDYVYVVPDRILEARIGRKSAAVEPVSMSGSGFPPPKQGS
ncbi:MAG: polysaccharide biosynthesis tyrosine autokinase [Deltaproteobacteria bacterium]|nr:polysaccharide biosynthesis tyrosine autokinase [Deltaproteobacteria bacterium]